MKDNNGPGKYEHLGEGGSNESLRIQHPHKNRNPNEGGRSWQGHRKPPTVFRDRRNLGQRSKRYVRIKQLGSEGGGGFVSARWVKWGGGHPIDFKLLIKIYGQVLLLEKISYQVGSTLFGKELEFEMVGEKGLRILKRSSWKS